MKFWTMLLMDEKDNNEMLFVRLIFCENVYDKNIKIVFACYKPIEQTHQI